MLPLRVILCCAILSGFAHAQEVPEPFERFSQPARPDAAAQAREEKLKLAVAQHPDSPDAWTDLGWRLYVNGHYGQSEYAMAQARRYSPADPYVLWLSGLASYAMQHYGDAHQFLWQLFHDYKSYPPTVDAGMMYDLLGRVALHDRDLFTASFMFAEAEDLEPRNWQIHVMRGIAEWYRQRYGESMDELERARDLRPHDPLILDAYAWAKAAVEERDFAALQAEAELLDKPKPLKQDIGPALAAIAAAQKADPKNPDNYELQGRVLLASGDSAGAERALRRALDLDPASPGASYVLAKVLVSGGSPRGRVEAKELLLQSVAHAPGYWEGDDVSPNGHLLAQMFAEEGSYDRAQALLDWLERQDEAAEKEGR